MDYYEIDIEHHLDEIGQDLLVDELAGAGFESFETGENLLKAYIPASGYEAGKSALDALLRPYAPRIGNWSERRIPDQDWNAVWESQYEPVRFGDFCFVHAPFHAPLPQARYNIEIAPKMSFGTAHHPTTALMIRFLEEMPPVGESVLDMGCGTGVLGILAALQGAASVTSIDIDPWAFENARENVRRNGLPLAEGEDGSHFPGTRPEFPEPVPGQGKSGNAPCPVRIRMGDASLLQGACFDRILANINRNILLRDMQAYASALSRGGTLHLSGFYSQDMVLVEKECNAHRLFYQGHVERENWAAMTFVKK